MFFLLEGGMNWVIDHGLLFNFNFNGKKLPTNLLGMRILVIFFKGLILEFNSTYIST